MKPAHLGLLSALTASLCCLGPMLLALLGLGSLGIGAIFGRYSWWFILAAIGILVFAWRRYLQEASRCRAAHCETAQGKMTGAVLIFASVVVAIFVGVHL